MGEGPCPRLWEPVSLPTSSRIYSDWSRSPIGLSKAEAIYLCPPAKVLGFCAEGVEQRKRRTRAPTGGLLPTHHHREAPSPVSTGLSGRPRRNLVAQVRREEPNCWLCGHPIDLTLPRGHKLASTVDEIIPRSLGGSPLDRHNCRHAHMVCNSKRGNRPPVSTNRSRIW